jgi:hypothetical protein
MELEQLVSSAPAILRPRRFAVVGESAILMQLRELTGHEPLAKDAERLFARGSAPDGTYVARNGHWLPEVRPDVVALEPKPLRAASVAQLAPGALPLDVLVTRVAALEKSVQALQKLLETATRALRAEAENPRTGAVVHGASARQPTAADPHGATAAAVATPQPPPAARPVDPGAKVISLPSASALSELLRSLAGQGALLQPAERANWALLAAAGPVYAAALNDHDGQDVGAIIMDIEAALRLAGALLMESEDMITSLIEENMMSDDMLDASSEVCNTLMSSINKMSGNPHLRAGKIALLGEADASWLAAARKCDDYRYSHGGRVAIATR